MSPVDAQRTARSATFVTVLLVLVHATNDAFGGMLSALLPTIQARFGLTETVLASLVATLSFSSSVTQPVFGNLADALGRRRVAGLGVLASSALLSLMAVTPSVPLLFALLLVGGLGSAAFHPAGTGIARTMGGRRKSLAYAVFSAGGTIGVGAGPLVVGGLVMTGTLHLSPLLMIPGVLGGLALIVLVPPQPQPDLARRPRAFDLSLLRGPVGVLCVSGVLRSVSYVTFVNAIPLWLVTVRGLPTDSVVPYASLAVFNVAAGFGGIIAGALERRLSRQVLITGSMVAALAPLLVMLVLTPGSPSFYLAVALAGALVNAGLPPMVVAAQDLAPQAVGAASGLMMGFSWGVAGLLYIGVGALQEVLGIGPALALSYLTLIPGAVLATAVLRSQRAALAAADD